MARALACTAGVLLTAALAAGITAQIELRCSVGTFGDGTHYLSCENGVVCWIEGGDCTVMP